MASKHNKSITFPSVIIAWRLMSHMYGITTGGIFSSFYSLSFSVYIYSTFYLTAVLSKDSQKPLFLIPAGQLLTSENNGCVGEGEKTRTIHSIVEVSISVCLFCAIPPELKFVQTI